MYSVPPNCQFEVDDAEDEWLYNTKFSFIHGRALITCFRDHLSIFQKAYNALTPGGYFEMQDLTLRPLCNDGTLNGTAIEKWFETVTSAAAKIGRDWQCTHKYKQWFHEAGFEDVVERIYYWPMNPWPKGKRNKTLGLWAMTNGLDALPAVSMALMTRVLGMKPEEVELVLVDVRRDMQNRSIHAYSPM